MKSGSETFVSEPLETALDHRLPAVISTWPGLRSPGRRARRPALGFAVRLWLDLPAPGVILARRSSASSEVIGLRSTGSAGAVPGDHSTEAPSPLPLMALATWEAASS